MSKTLIFVILLQLISRVCNNGKQGICNKSVLITSVTIDKLQKCNIFEGRIAITDKTFKTMHPDKLDALKSITKIIGGLDITGHHEHFTNLSFLDNLESIAATDNAGNEMCIEIKNSSLTSIKLPAVKEIKCNIVIKDNNELCYADQWIDTDKISKDYIFKSTIIDNKNDAFCKCHEQCKGKCWGPEAQHCYDCKYHRINGTRNDYSEFTCIEDCISDKDTCEALCTSCEGPCLQKCYNEKIEKLNDLKIITQNMNILISLTIFGPVLNLLIALALAYYIRIMLEGIKKKVDTEIRENNL